MATYSIQIKDANGNMVDLPLVASNSDLVYEVTTTLTVEQANYIFQNRPLVKIDEYIYTPVYSEGSDGEMYYTSFSGDEKIVRWFMLGSNGPQTFTIEEYSIDNGEGKSIREISFEGMNIINQDDWNYLLENPTKPFKDADSSLIYYPIEKSSNTIAGDVHLCYYSFFTTAGDSIDKWYVLNLYNGEVSDIFEGNLQPMLVSGTNIKTINGESILTSGDLSLVTQSDFNATTGDIQTILDSLVDYVSPIMDGQGNVYTTIASDYEISTDNCIYLQIFAGLDSHTLGSIMDNNANEVELTITETGSRYIYYDGIKGNEYRFEDMGNGIYKADITEIIDGLGFEGTCTMVINPFLVTDNFLNYLIKA